MVGYNDIGVGYAEWEVMMDRRCSGPTSHNSPEEGPAICGRC